MRKLAAILLFLGTLLLLTTAPASAIVPTAPPFRPTISLSAESSGQVSGVSVMFVAFSIAALLGLLNVALFALAVTSQFRRSLIYDESIAWEDPQYLRALPNFLALLNSRRFASPWPRHCNPWSMRFLEFRLRRAARPLLKRRTRTFISQHLSLWIWVESHRAECRQLQRIRQVELALERLSRTTNPTARARLLAFLHSPAPDALSAVSKENHRRLRLLERLHVIMREHGYSVSPEFNEVDRLTLATPESAAEILGPRNPQ